jgi:hypothetical protein
VKFSMNKKHVLSGSSRCLQLRVRECTIDVVS